MRASVRHALIGLALLALALPAVAQAPPTVDQLVAKYVAARGGEEKLKSLSTMKLSGSITVQGADMTVTVLSKRPNLVKQEMAMQGMRIVQAFDGTQVWAINPMLGSNTPKAIEGPQADAIKSQALFDGPLVGYKERGDTLEFVGPADVDGAKTWKLKLTRKDGKSMHIFVDADTGLERQWSATIDQNGLTMEVDTVMSDYQPVNGVPVPHTMRTVMNGQAMGTLKVTSVEFNVPVEDAEFKMPQPQP
jgi:outer membrane lipoprotein-sorting protein